MGSSRRFPIQVRLSSCKVSEKRGIILGGHRCEASHKVYDDKVSEWSLENRVNLVMRVKMMSVSALVWDLVGLINRLFLLAIVLFEL